MANISMYMVTHVPVNKIPKGRIPIFVGNGNNVENYITDSTGENISNKNKNYCELTAYYWIWKNDKTSDYVSVEHYRRFFMKSCLFPRFLEKRDLEKFATDKKILTTTFSRTKLTVGEFYRQRHYGEDLERVRVRIAEAHPEYLSKFDEVMNSHAVPMFNMIAMPKELFDQYCEWLFDILFYVEKNTCGLSDRTPYQQRIYGFLSERLLNVWIEYNKYSRDTRDVYYFEKNVIFSILKSIRNRIPATYHTDKPRR